MSNTSPKQALKDFWFQVAYEEREKCEWWATHLQDQGFYTDINTEELARNIAYSRAKAKQTQTS